MIVRLKCQYGSDKQVKVWKTGDVRRVLGGVTK